MRRGRPALAALLLLATTLLLAGCGGGGGPKTYDDPHGTIQVKPHETFAITLVVNASVGYDWQVVPFGFDPSPITLPKISTSYPDEDRAGASGTKRFVFTAKRTGHQTLVFQHTFRGRPKDRRVIAVEVAG